MQHKTILILSGVILNSLGRWLPAQYDAYCFRMWAVAIVLWLMAAKIGEQSKRIRIVWDWAIGLAIANVWDEFIGDPTTCGKVEIIIAITISLCTIYRLKKCNEATPNT